MLRCKLLFFVVIAQLNRFGLFLLFTEYFKPPAWLWFLNLFFLFMLCASFKFCFVLCKRTLIFCILQKTAVRLLIFLFKAFYSFFTYIVSEYFPCLLHHWNASASSLTILSSTGLFSLSPIICQENLFVFHSTSWEIGEIPGQEQKLTYFRTFSDARTSLHSTISHTDPTIQQMVSQQLRKDSHPFLKKWNHVKTRIGADHSHSWELLLSS